MSSHVGLECFAPRLSFPESRAEDQVANSYPQLSGALYAFPLALGGGLLLAGFRYAFDQHSTGESFGVPPSVSAVSPTPGGPRRSGDVYMTVAGIRTFILGANIVGFALLRDRRATGLATLWAVLVPIADGAVAFEQSATPWKTAITFHWGPAVLAGYLAYALLVLWCARLPEPGLRSLTISCFRARPGCSPVATCRISSSNLPCPPEV